MFFSKLLFLGIVIVIYNVIFIIKNIVSFLYRCIFLLLFFGGWVGVFLLVKFGVFICVCNWCLYKRGIY